MGIFDKFMTKAQKERSVWKSQVRKRATQEARKVYAEEAVEQAKKRAIAKARREPLTSFIGRKAKGYAAKKLSQPRKKSKVKKYKRDFTKTNEILFG